MQGLQLEQNTAKIITESIAKWLKLLMSVLNPAMEIVEPIRLFLTGFQVFNNIVTKRSKPHE